jgi:hypothetical protein
MTAKINETLDILEQQLNCFIQSIIASAKSSAKSTELEVLRDSVKVIRTNCYEKAVRSIMKLENELDIRLRSLYASESKELEAANVQNHTSILISSVVHPVRTQKKPSLKLGFSKEQILAMLKRLE